MGSLFRLAALLPFLLGANASAQTTPQPPPRASLPATQFFDPAADDLPRIRKEAVPSLPFSVLGPRGCLLGQGDGSFEAWVFPWKIFSGMTISAEMKDYPVPIQVNELAAGIDVQPHRTVITYSHANFTIRQIMFAPKEGPGDVGALVYFEIAAVRPVTLTFSFHPVMQRMWPAESPDVPSPEWVPDSAGSGFYILHLNEPSHAAALAIPGALPGILPPYQERARAWPLQFVLHFDPATESHKLFPLLLTFSNTAQESGKAALSQSLAHLNTVAPDLFVQNRTYYRNLLDTHTAIETPDATLNQAFSWAVAAIDQLKVKTTPDLKEEALTAGFVGSGDAARPGFGWFFGRDALWTLYAVDSYGDFSTLHSEIEFLLKRQSPEGKIMHEWSQTANLVDWASTPYEFASADATALLPMVMNDYLQISGDKAFIAAHWDQLVLAWRYETTHTSPDGIYNNVQGSGWVESWVPSMPHQELYLAALDQQASTAFAQIARSAGHPDVALQAESRAAAIAKTIEAEYYLPSDQSYAFSRNADGSADRTATIFPAVAWWDGSYSLNHAEPMLGRWASAEFSTDWGTRLLSDRTSFYDPISYHQGSVWPLFTGWVSVAEYRAGHPLSGYAHLMQNADLTWAGDPGSVTELLSGRFYGVLGRSTAHQLWSSAMVISPILRGLFGIRWKAQEHTLSLSPHLPAGWNEATVRRLPIGDEHVDLSMRREGTSLLITAMGTGARGLRLTSDIPGSRMGNATLRIPLPPVEVSVAHSLPALGSETTQLKFLNEQLTAHSVDLTLSAPAGSSQTLSVRVNDAHAHITADGGILASVHNGAAALSVPFPGDPAQAAPQPTYVTRIVHLRW